MKIDVGCVVLALVAGVVPVAQGRNGVEFKSKDKATHYFDNSGEWQCSGVSGEVLPVNGDTVRMAGLGNDCTVYLRGNTTLAAKTIEFKGGYTSAQSRQYGFLRFAGDGYTFLMPSIAEGATNADGNTFTYADNPFKFGCCVSGTDRWFIYNDGFSSTSIAPLKMTNPDFVCGITADGANYITFTKGVFNFCDPEGTANGSTLRIGALQSIASTITLASNATLRMDKGELSTPSAATGVTTFKHHGAVEAVTSFVQQSGTWEIDGGTFATPALTIAKGSFLATNAAALNVTTYKQSGGTARMALGSTVSATSTVTVEGSASPALTVAGGTFTANGSVCLGHGSSSYNGSIVVSGGSLPSGSADGLQVGTSGGSGTFEISGGTATFKRVRLGRGSGSGNTTLRQTGGNLDVSNSSYGYDT